MQEQDLPTFRRPQGRSPLALGVCIGNRETGLALATRERLLRAEVAAIEGVDADRRASAILTRIRKVLDAYTPSHIALVSMHAPTALGPLRSALRAHLEGLSKTWDFTLREYDALSIRLAHVLGARPTNASLRSAMSRRFPELADPAGSRPSSVPCVVRVFPSSRERRASRLFLAVGGALHHLDEALKHQFVS